MDQVVSIRWAFLLAAVVLYALAVMAVVVMYGAADAMVAPVTFSTEDPFSSLQELTTFVPIPKDGSVPIPSL